MMKSWFFSCLLFLPGFMWAHEPDASQILFVEQENGIWQLQVEASLTAFEGQIHHQYGDTAYTSPNEFRQLMQQLLRENLHLVVNEKDTLKLAGAGIKLGHECQVAFEVPFVPQKIEALEVRNQAFAAIHQHQSKLVILKKGFSPSQFFLNTSNQYQLHLEESGDQFVVRSPLSIWLPSLLLVLPLVCLFFVWGFRHPKSLRL